jgi:hypothetical protein
MSHPLNHTLAYNLHLEALAMLIIRYKMSAGDAAKELHRLIARLGEAADYSATEIAERVGLKKSTIYNYANQPQPKFDDPRLPELVIDALVQSAAPLSAVQIAGKLHEDRGRVADALDALVGSSIEAIEGTDPVLYQMIAGVVGYNQPYPTTLNEFEARRFRAAEVVEGPARDPERSVSMTAPMLADEARQVLDFFRDYSNKLPSEKSLDRLVRESAAAPRRPNNEPFKALLLFSPDRGERDAVDHFHSCAELYCHPDYEMIPFRHQLDEIAIAEFFAHHFDGVKDEISDLLTKHRSQNSAAPLYRISFICS